MQSEVKIFYFTDNTLKSGDALDIMFYGNVDIKMIEESYVEVYSSMDEVGDDIFIYLEKMFEKFNNDENPLSGVDQQNKISYLNTHTSMSVGDVVKINDTYYVAKGTGFSKIF